MGRQHQGMDRPGVWQVPEGSGEQGKMEGTGCEIICGAPMTLVVRELTMKILHSTQEMLIYEGKILTLFFFFQDYHKLSNHST